MGGPRSKVSREEILALFQTEEPFKSVAARIGMSPNTLRGIWKETFGEDAFKERGQRLQAQAASQTAKRVNQNKTYSEITIPCSKCQIPQVLKANQVAQMEATTFICEACRCNRRCPVCGLFVDGERGLSGHFRHRREAGDAAHIQLDQEIKDSQWAALQLDEDYVACLECKHQAFTLARHLKAEHGITADQYREKYPGALIRARKLTETRSAAIRAGWGVGVFTGTKTVLCPSCGMAQEKPKQVGSLHEHRCAACRIKAEAARWEGLVEPQDYVTCLDCGYRTENLTSHVQNAHPDYRGRHPDAYVVALGSAIRDKIAIRGVPRTPEFGQKIREAKLLNLTRVAFEPFLDPDGTVDHRRMLAAIGCAWSTLKGYIDALGLRATQKYVEQAAGERRVVLTAEQLESFKLGNGKISIAKAMPILKLCNHTIKRECHRLGLEWAHGNVSQRKCLDALAEALGGLSFEEEWKSWRFVNPLTGHRFRFDGHFPDVALIVEFQGKFHYEFPNAFMVNESYLPAYEALRERDRIKRSLIQAASDLTYFEVLEDEPYMDVSYLRGRLVELGILSPGNLAMSCPRTGGIDPSGVLRASNSDSTGPCPDSQTFQG